MHGFVFLLSVSASTEELPFPVEESGTDLVETSKGLSVNSVEALPPEYNIDLSRNTKGEVTIMLIMRMHKSCLLKICCL